MEDPNKPWPPRFPPAPRGTDQRTLTQIERDDWGKPTFGSHLVQTCYALRHKPVGTFTVEDLRIMIGQKFSLLVLIPPALEHLNENPLAQGDYFPGDLLRNVLQIDATFWRAHPELDRRAREVAKKALIAFEERARVLAQRDVWGEEGGVDPGDVVAVVHTFLDGR